MKNLVVTTLLASTIILPEIAAAKGRSGGFSSGGRSSGGFRSSSSSARIGGGLSSSSSRLSSSSGKFGFGGSSKTKTIKRPSGYGGSSYSSSNLLLNLHVYNMLMLQRNSFGYGGSTYILDDSYEGLNLYEQEELSPYDTFRYFNEQEENFISLVSKMESSAVKLLDAETNSEIRMSETSVCKSAAEMDKLIQGVLDQENVKRYQDKVSESLKDLKAIQKSNQELCTNGKINFTPDKEGIAFGFFKTPDNEIKAQTAGPVIEMNAFAANIIDDELSEILYYEIQKTNEEAAVYIEEKGLQADRDQALKLIAALKNGEGEEFLYDGNSKEIKLTVCGLEVETRYFERGETLGEWSYIRSDEGGFVYDIIESGVGFENGYESSRKERKEIRKAITDRLVSEIEQRDCENLLREANN